MTENQPIQVAPELGRRALLGAAAAAGLFAAEPVDNRLWHIPFNRVDDELIVDMVRGNANGFSPRTAPPRPAN